MSQANSCVLERVVVDGFWGRLKADVVFQRDVNFLIGPNGSGKTTLINLIAAALSADFSVLSALQFSRITLFLAQTKGRKKPRLEVTKAYSSSAPHNRIVYRIWEKASGSPMCFEMDWLEEESVRQSRQELLRLRHKTRTLAVTLEGLINIIWLSIRRTSPEARRTQHSKQESPLEHKLTELSHSFMRMISILEQQASDLTQKFQEKVFLSLVQHRNVDAMLHVMSQLDTEAERRTICDILDKFGIPKTTYAEDVDDHFSSLETSLGKLRASEGFEISELVALVTSYCTHGLVDSWQNVKKIQTEIMQPIEDFLTTANNLLNGKKLVVSDSNEVAVRTTLDEDLELNDLSSGEKQLIIFLGEAVLQEHVPWLYLADEPELSLHIEWQELLVDSLLSLNPSAQIIFATHSPDIVASYQKSSIDMQDILA